MIGREGIKTSLPASYKEIFFGFQVLRALCICLRARSRNRRLGAHSNINRKSVPNPGQGFVATYTLEEKTMGKNLSTSTYLKKKTDLILEEANETTN